MGRSGKGRGRGHAAGLDEAAEVVVPADPGRKSLLKVGNRHDLNGKHVNLNGQV